MSQICFGKSEAKLFQIFTEAEKELHPSSQFTHNSQHMPSTLPLENNLYTLPEQSQLTLNTQVCEFMFTHKSYLETHKGQSTA